MIRRFWTAFALTLVAGVFVAGPPASASELSWQGDGSAPLYEQWAAMSDQEHCAVTTIPSIVPDKEIELVNDARFARGNAIRFHMVGGSPCYSGRVELQQGNPYSPSKVDRRFYSGQDLWIAWQAVFPNSYAFGGNGGGMMQIHRTSNGKSPFGMALRNNREPGTGRLTIYWIDNSGAFIEDTVAILSEEAPYDLVVHYVARNTQTGSWQVYGAEAGKPLTLLEQKENVQTILPDQSGSPTEPNFATIGLYPGEVAPGDELRIGGFNVQPTREAAEAIAFNAATPATAATYVSQFTGSGISQLSHPGGIARDEEGNLWVVDTNNNRVEKFDASGEWQSVGATGSVGGGLLSHPVAVAIDPKGDVWVCDQGNNRILEFDGEGRPLKVVGINAGLREPEGMTLDAKGDVWVSDTYNHRLVEFDPEGNNPTTVGSGQIGEPEGISADPQGNVWVADWSLHAIEEFNENGELARKFLIPHAAGRYPFVVVRDSDGHLWEAAMGGDERVEKLSETGEFLGAFGPIGGSGPGHFAAEYPIGIATDSAHDIWVTDGSNNRVQRWMRR